MPSKNTKIHRKRKFRKGIAEETRGPIHHISTISFVRNVKKLTDLSFCDVQFLSILSMDDKLLLDLNNAILEKHVFNLNSSSFLIPFKAT